MQKILYVILFFLISFNINAEMIKPDPKISAKDVISIQLKALQNNNVPFENAGIVQTWEFAHPDNRLATGPLQNFTLMILKSFTVMINHKSHKIKLLKKNDILSFYIIEIEDKNSNQYQFQWVVQKVEKNEKFKNCWMTVNVSMPIFLNNAA